MSADEKLARVQQRFVRQRAETQRLIKGIVGAVADLQGERSTAGVVCDLIALVEGEGL